MRPDMRRMIWAAVLLAPSAWADEVAVKEGAAVSGTVTLRGKPARPVEAGMPKDLDPQDRKFCSAKQPLTPPFYVFDPAGRLKDVVVWLEGARKPKAPASGLKKLVNGDCRFLPHVQTMSVGEELQVENHDPILHNTHPVFLADQSTLFNIALPMQGQTVKKKVRRPGMVRVQCDAGHVWMRAFVHIFDHPYHAVTGVDGTFRITGVPPGKYTLKWWHEAAGSQSQEIEIPGDGQVTHELAVEAK